MAKINMANFTARLMAGAKGEIKKETELERSMRLKCEEEARAKKEAVDARKARYAATRKARAEEAKALREPKPRVIRATLSPEQKREINRDRVREYKRKARTDKTKCISCHGAKVGNLSRCRACRIYAQLEEWGYVSPHIAPLVAQIRAAERAEATNKENKA